MKPSTTPPPLYSQAGIGWTFLTNHCHVLACLNQYPGIRIREISTAVGITDRAVLRILGELQEAGALTKIKDGRRNSYRINLDFPLRHPLHSGHTIGEILKDLGKTPLQQDEIDTLLEQASGRPPGEPILKRKG